MPSCKERLAAASSLHQAGQLVEAERLYGEILRDHPDDADALHFSGILAHQTARNELAVDLIDKAIARNPHVPAFHNNRGNALKALGKLDAAAQAYRRALECNANYAPAYYNLGVVRQAQRLFEDAAACYARAIAYQPNHVAALLNFGNVLQAQGKLDEAAAAYRRALQHKPNYTEAHGNLGNVLKSLGKLDEALACYRQALHLEPDYAEAHNNLGILLFERGSIEEAVGAYRAALAVKPDYVEAHCNLGTALTEQGRPTEGMASFERALQLQPDYAEARMGLAIAVIPIVADRVEDSARAGEQFARALDDMSAWNLRYPGRLQSSVGSHQPFYLAYRPGNVRALLSRYGDLVSAPATAGEHRNSGSQGRRATPDRIRLVIVCGHVRRHPVWDMLLRGIIAHVDRGRFAVFLYHTGSLRDDETVWAGSHVDRFVQGPKSLAAWQTMIIQDRPDVIFYPEVGMDSICCAMAALRLAPLQVAGWGHPVTTGLPTMDRFLSGELLEAPEADEHYREQLIRLDGTGVCTESIAMSAPDWEGPTRIDGVTRFALCQQPIKFDPADDGYLIQIAKAVGPSEFWLCSPLRHAWAAAKLQERLARAFLTAGLDPDAQLRMTPWLSRSQFAGFLDAMDIYLDCPAFSGYTTAHQAAQRGLPIVTVEGDFLRQRLAAGLLRQIRVTDGIVATREQYVDLAIRWAQESRRSESWSERRSAMARAAAAADGNRSAVRAFEQAIANGLPGRLRVSHPTNSRLAP